MSTTSDKIPTVMHTKRCPEIKRALSNDTKIALNLVWNNSRCPFDSKTAALKNNDAIWTLIIRT